MTLEMPAGRFMEVCLYAGSDWLKPLTLSQRAARGQPHKTVNDQRTLAVITVIILGRIKTTARLTISPYSGRKLTVTLTNTNRQTMEAVP